MTHTPSRFVLVATAVAVCALLLEGCADSDEPVATGAAPAEDSVPSQSLPGDIDPGGAPIVPDGADDSCDRAFSDYREFPDPASLEELVGQTTWIGEATVGSVSERETSPEDDQLDSVSTLVAFTPSETWLGEPPASLSEPIVVSTSYFTDAGELAEAYGDHRLETLEEGGTVVLFLSQISDDGVSWIDPSPILVRGGQIQFGECGVRIAEQAGASDIVALDGASVDEARAQIEAAAS